MTTYSDAQRAEATALAISLGPSGDKQAARQYGIPARTIRRWVQLVRQGDQRGEAIMTAETREQVAERFWSVVSRGTERMVDALNDPKTPARDIARIVEVGFTSHSLMAGGPTARTETVQHSDDGQDADSLQWWDQAAGGPLSWGERGFVRESFDLGAYWLYREMVRELRASRREGREPVVVDPAGVKGGEFIYDPRKQALEHQTEPEQPSPDAAWHASMAQLTDGRNGQ